MKYSSLLTAALLAMLAPSAVGAAIVDFSGNQEFGRVAGQLVLTISGGQVTGGQVTGGYATISGAGLPHRETLGVITNYGYPGPSTGYRSEDWTDVYGGDTFWPIDYNGLIFGTNPGSTGGYAFAIWNNDASQPLFGTHYQTWMSGPGGQGNFYNYSGASSFTVSAPVLSTWAMMVAGFAGLGLVGRRRQKVAHAA
jgi:hypothetical protein